MALRYEQELPDSAEALDQVHRRPLNHAPLLVVVAAWFHPQKYRQAETLQPDYPHSRLALAVV
jgi:hypothetical protein